MGTRLLLEAAGDLNTSGSKPEEMNVFRDRVFFRADDGMHGEEVWMTDGSTVGTHIYRDLNLGSGSSRPDNFQLVNQ